ncbi:hypothetical protein, partial [Ottowia sp.]|uniref:hypothetical protein n=1 Tax=Ottowia sp. TaxID=1898956 RepID=UPI003A83C513
MGSIKIPSFPAVQARGGMLTPQMPGARGDPTATARLAAQSLEPYNQMGQAMQQLGSLGVSIATEMQREVNRAQLLDFQNKAQRAGQELTLGVGDEPGYQSFKGQSALLAGADGADLSSQYGNKLKTRLDDLASNLTTDAQKQAAAVWRESFEADFGGRVQAYQQGEFERFQVSNESGAIEIGINNATADWRSDEAVRNA